VAARSWPRGFVEPPATILIERPHFEGLRMWATENNNVVKSMFGFCLYSNLKLKSGSSNIQNRQFGPRLSLKSAFSGFSLVSSSGIVKTVQNQRLMKISKEEIREEIIRT